MYLSNNWLLTGEKVYVFLILMRKCFNIMSFTLQWDWRTSVSAAAHFSRLHTSVFLPAEFISLLMPVCAQTSQCICRRHAEFCSPKPGFIFSSIVMIKHSSYMDEHRLLLMLTVELCWWCSFQCVTKKQKKHLSFLDYQKMFPCFSNPTIAAA